MDSCHLKNSEPEKEESKKYKGRVVLRGEVVEHDSGSYAVFTEQGSSASHTTAATVLGVISRLPGCAGQASDAPKLLGFQESEWPAIWTRLPRSRCPKSWCEIQDAVVPCERNLHGLPSAGLLLERPFEKVLIKKMVGTKCQTKKVSSCTAKRPCVSRSMWTTKNGLSETHVGHIDETSSSR